MTSGTPRRAGTPSRGWLSAGPREGAPRAAPGPSGPLLLPAPEELELEEDEEEREDEEHERDRRRVPHVVEAKGLLVDPEHEHRDLRPRRDVGALGHDVDLGEGGPRPDRGHDGSEEDDRLQERQLYPPDRLPLRGTVDRRGL